MIEEARTVELVPARFRYQAGDSSPGPAVFRRGAVRHDVELLDGLETDFHRGPGVVVVVVIETVDQFQRVSAVPSDVEIRMRGRGSGYIHIRRLFAHSRIQRDQRTQRPVQHRQFLHFRVLEIGRHMGLCDFHQGRLTCDVHGL